MKEKEFKISTKWDEGEGRGAKADCSGSNLTRREEKTFFKGITK